MSVTIAYTIAAASLAVLLTLWFVNAYQVLTRKKTDVTGALNQVRLHREGFHQVRGSHEERAARRMLDTSKQIYTQIEKSYDEALRKPLYRLPGYIMGFRTSSGVSRQNKSTLRD